MRPIRRTTWPRERARLYDQLAATEKATRLARLRWDAAEARRRQALRVVVALRELAQQWRTERDQAQRRAAELVELLDNARGLAAEVVALETDLVEVEPESRGRVNLAADLLKVLDGEHAEPAGDAV